MILGERMIHTSLEIERWLASSKTTTRSTSTRNPADSQCHETQRDPDSEVWETTTDSAQLAMFGTLDVNSVLGNTENPILLRPIHRSGVDQFIVANNLDIPNFCRAKLQAVSELNNKRKMEGDVTEVHKPLASACEISKYHDTFIFEEFGALIPDTAELRKAYDESVLDCCQLHGYHGIQLLYREGILYN